MPDTGWLDVIAPIGDITDDASAGSVAWANPHNAGANDTTYAVATIGGSVVEAEVKLVVAGAIVGDNKSDGSSYPGSDAYATRGGPNDKWNSGITTATARASDCGVAIRASGSLNSTHYIKALNFGASALIPEDASIQGVEIRYDRSAAGRVTITQIDHIQVKFYYAEAAAFRSRIAGGRVIC